jgi:hypothetical protein
MSNQSNPHTTNKSSILMKSALAGVLAFGIGAGSVYASDDAAVVTTATESSPAVTNATDIEEKPSLLPGDFFYFIKSIYENIRLAITVNDLKEAKLLTELAKERLSEAQALIEEGEQEKAEAVLQLSIDTQVKAVIKIEGDAGAEAEVKVEGQTESMDQVKAEAAAEKESVAEEKDEDEQVVKVKTDLQHNILALTAALEKVENPRAQEALLKNIEKAFGHLEKKLTKLESKMAKKSEADTVSAAAGATTETTAQTSTTASSDQSQTDSVITISTDPAISVDGTVQLMGDFETEKEDKADKPENEKKVKKEHKEKEEKAEKTDKNGHDRKSKAQHGKPEDKNNSGK